MSNRFVMGVRDMTATEAGTAMTTNQSGSAAAIRQAMTEDLDAIRELMIDIFEQDFGYGYNPVLHGDVDDLQGTYLDNPRHILLVAVDDASGTILGTAGVRSGGLKPQFNHAWLVERYDPET